jgi:asparagine synthase (glutamine-hydrolysing)
MCGIAGKVGSERIDAALIAEMSAVLEHRGPDAGGSFVDDGAGLGVRRLAIIDVETGDQPVFNEDRSALVILNGEIYNYVELREQLERRGHRFRTKSDTEVIVHLYEDHGAECVQQLRGMFAFAVWDRRNRRLLLARDRLGKKPLYYAQRGDTLWFGSEVRALLQDPELPREADHESIDAYLQLQYVPNPRSAFLGVSKLAPAHTLTWQAGNAEARRYWRLSYAPAEEPLEEGEACERIRDGLMEATRLRLRSDVPLGAFLSGGIDSSAVVAAMARQSQSRVRTFSIGFDERRFDERPYARLVAEAFDTEHQEFVVRPDAMGIVPRIAWHYGEPFADHSAIPTLQLAELTSRHVKVALNGDGGDENFAGYARYRAGAFAFRLARLPEVPRRGVATALRLTARAPLKHARRRRLERMSEAMLAPRGERFATWLAFFTRPELDRLYTPDFRESLSPFSVGRLIDDLMGASDADSLTNTLLDADIQTYLAGDLLVKMDIATMAHSLEVRSPLLDQEFMSLAASLPASLKLHRGDHKRIFKKAVAPLLPKQILARPKMGFTVPLAHWFRDELSELPREVLLDEVATGRGIFRPDGVRELIDDHVAGRADNANRIWALVQLELWFRTFIDARRTSPLTLSAA